MILYAEGPQAGDMETILPHAKVALGLNLGRPHKLGKSSAKRDNTGFGASWFTGLQTSPLYHHPPSVTRVHGLIFDPLGFSEMFPRDMTATKDATVDAIETVGSQFGARLLDLCRQALDTESIHQALASELLSRFRNRTRHPDWLWAGYRQICDSQGQLRLADLYRDLDVSGRHFSQTFQAATGLSPKALSRVLRLNSVLTALDPNRDVSWSRLAHDAGYADQSHFNRDFRHFSGMTPKRYLKARRAAFPPVQPGEDVSFVPSAD